MALHEQCVGATDEWYTPPEVFDALGLHFDLDVAAPGLLVKCVLDPVTWIPAAEFITADSLSKSWAGRVWMNPPFGGRNALDPWLAKFMDHGHGIALVPDRTSAPWFQKYAALAGALLFVSPKLKFIDQRGKRGKSPAQGTCLMARGEDCVHALIAAERKLGLAVIRP